MKTTTRRFTGQYADDGKAQRLRVRAESGHRCIRCQHPFESGKHGKGEWSPCDDRCTHKGPIRFVGHAPPIISHGGIAGEWVKDGIIVEAEWRILTVHHLTGEKDNDAWWNLLSLCQRCHLHIQTKVDPRIPWMFSHSEWAKPFMAGFYAHIYEGKLITREEAIARLDQLLAYELKTV